MLPEKLFRTQNGCVFEESTEAQHESVQEAAIDVITILTEPKNRYAKDGDTLIETRAEIKKAMNTLAKALEGKLVTTYTI